MRDLREEFSRVLNDYGYYVLVIHNNKKRRCTCWDDKTREASKNCPYCFGLGYTPIIEKHLCRSKITSTTRSVAKLINMTDYGEVLYPSRCYYFKYNVRLVPEDLVVECEFKENGSPELSDYSIFKVNFTEGLRGDHGRTEYNRAYCDLDPVNMDLIIGNLRRSGSRSFYELGFRR